MSELLIALFMIVYGATLICASGGNYFVILVGLAASGLGGYTLMCAIRDLRRQARKARGR